MRAVNGGICGRVFISTSVIRRTFLHLILISTILCGNRSSCRLNEFVSSPPEHYVNLSSTYLKGESAAITLQSLFISVHSLQSSAIASHLAIIPTASKSVDIKTEENLNDLSVLPDMISVGFPESTTSCNDESSVSSSSPPLEMKDVSVDDKTVFTETVQEPTLVTAEIITPSQEDSSATVVETLASALTNETLSQSEEQTNQTAEVTTPDTEAMPSFDEWKKKKQAELSDGEKSSLAIQQSNGVVSGSGGGSSSSANGATSLGKKVTASQKRRRNYASYECGAKVVASNKESEGSGRILNEQMDEYMLNPCRAKIWFVIELCDTIQVSQLELANFELFSSLPKEFSVSASDHYPTRDWTPLGNFVAQDQRVLHSFPLMQQGYGKFLKVELLSHYGKEHYCPLSVVHVFGTSMVDEFEDLEATEHAPLPTSDEEDGPVIPSTIQTETPSDIFGSAKQAVMTLFNKAAQALGREGVEVPSGEGAAPDSNLSVRSVHQAAVFSGHVLDDQDSSSQCSSMSQYDLHQVALLCGFCDSASPVLQSYKCRFMQAVFNITGINEVCLSSVCKPQEMINTTKVTEKGSVLDKIEPSSNTAGSVLSISQSTKLSSSGYMETVHLDSSGESVANVESTANSSHPSVHVKTESLPSVTLAYVDASTISSEQTAEVLQTFQFEPSASSPVTISTSPVDIYPESTMPVDLPDDVVMEVPVLVDEEMRSGTKTEPAGAPISSTQKESVFVRLNNRIRLLEVNLSLSSQYLQELSQRYRKQMEDMQKTFNRTVAALNQTAVQAAERDQSQQASLSALQKQMEHMTGLVERMRVRNKTLYREVLETHLFIIAVEAIIVVTVLTLCWRRYHLHHDSTTDIASQLLTTFCDENPPSMSAIRTPLKRHHSVCDLVTSNISKKRRPSESVSTAGTYSDLMIVEPAIPIYIEQPHKAKKRHRKRKNKGNFLRSISNSNLACIYEVMDNTKLVDHQSSASSKAGRALFTPSSSQEGSENCENCNPIKLEDDGVHSKVPFQNLTNTKVNKDESGACKEHFSLRKPLKISEKKGAV